MNPIRTVASPVGKDAHLFRARKSTIGSDQREIVHLCSCGEQSPGDIDSAQTQEMATARHLVSEGCFAHRHLTQCSADPCLCLCIHLNVSGFDHCQQLPHAEW